MHTFAPTTPTHCTMCDVCGLTCSRRGALRRHQESAHGGRTFGCNDCDEKFNHRDPIAVASTSANCHSRVSSVQSGIRRVLLSFSPCRFIIWTTRDTSVGNTGRCSSVSKDSTPTENTPMEAGECHVNIATMLLWRSRILQTPLQSISPSKRRSNSRVQSDAGRAPQTVFGRNRDQIPARSPLSSRSSRVGSKRSKKASFALILWFNMTKRRGKLF
jgi:hypothetical protein